MCCSTPPTTGQLPPDCWPGIATKTGIPKTSLHRYLDAAANDEARR